MPSKCIVRECNSNYTSGRSFFNLPAHLNYKYAGGLSELSKKRRLLWLDALGLEEAKLPQGLVNICSKHFVKGKPALLEQSLDIDWVPSLYLNKPVTAKTIFEKVAQQPQSDKRKRIVGPASVKRNAKSNIHLKGDLKKSYNCKVFLENSLQSNLFNGTNGSGLAIAQKHGRFTSDNVTLREVALNNTIVRIPLIRENLKVLKRKFKLYGDVSNTKKRKEPLKVSSFGRQIKKKAMFYDDSFETINYSPIKVQQTYKQSGDVNKVVQNKQKNDSFKSSVRATPILVKGKFIKEEKSSIHTKLQNNSKFERYPENKNKTLNRVIKRNDKEKFKIKLFSKSTSTPIRSDNKNKLTTTLVKSKKPLELHREILFVRQNEDLWKPSEKTYFLKLPLNRYSLKDGRLNYPFQKLVRDIKNMKLPAPSWKIKVVIKENKISAVTFTNKLELERCVSFFTTNEFYKIIIDNQPAVLLGSPEAVNCAEDIEVLLDILENIDAQNSMILYK